MQLGFSLLWIKDGWKESAEENKGIKKPDTSIIAMFRSRISTCVQQVTFMGDMIHAYITLVGKPLARFKLGHREIRYEIVDWTHLVQDRVQCRAFEITVMSLWVSYKVGNFLSWAVALFSCRAVFHGVSQFRVHRWTVIYTRSPWKPVKFN
jgi:hypothetical protein